MVSPVAATLATQSIETASQIQDAQLKFFKKNLDGQANNLLKLVESVPQPTGQQPLATSGSVGTRLNVFA